jgi:hypothetical protein
MTSLAKQVLDAHGGIDRWNQFRSVKARISSGGGLWSLKGLVQDAVPRDLTVSLHEEFASVAPYGQPDWRTAFTPNRIAIETTSGALVRERIDPRASFAGHVMNTPWDPLDRAYSSTTSSKCRAFGCRRSVVPMFAVRIASRCAIS